MSQLLSLSWRNVKGKEYNIIELRYAWVVNDIYLFIHVLLFNWLEYFVIIMKSSLFWSYKWDCYYSSEKQRIMAAKCKYIRLLFSWKLWNIFLIHWNQISIYNRFIMYQFSSLLEDFIILDDLKFEFLKYYKTIRIKHFSNM